MRILIFGDSITQGFYDSRGGWANRLAAHYHGQTAQAAQGQGGSYFSVFNLGVPGDTVAGVLERLEVETEIRDPEEPLALIFAIGINDAILRNNRAYREEYQFEAEVERLVKKARHMSDRVLFAGLSAVDEQRTDPLAGSSTGKQYLNNRINLFEDCIKQVCARYETPFVPAHDSFLVASKKHALLVDGLHPNDAGHDLLLETYMPAVDVLLS